MVKTGLRADARRNRAKVLAAAEEAFAADGLAVPLDDIARLAGVGAGTVYRHFPSKDALFRAVVVERIEQFTAEAGELAAAEDPGEAFFGYFARVIKQASHNRAICDALTRTGDSDVRGFRGSRADVGESFRAAFATLLHRAQAAGAVRTDVDGDDLRALVTGCLAAERCAPGSGHLVDVVVDGLRRARES